VARGPRPGYRAAARRAHPDTGGDTVAMQAVNAAREALVAFLEQQHEELA
jgi:curved DNA-binding protein CbpA